ncbi:internal scaffolding protein [Blackfly microvirus SF02]|uniref:Internal scaffolding protein n=1 Tax=Blackfly microvirus SF02 TaxID=2576452 RepID=A0A4P8PKI6_9VIRU|nr:internal scaffolding protein [Blackfly microvirus SF02]
MRTEFNYDRDAASDETSLYCRDPSKTVQADADSADINVIMDRFLKTGVVVTAKRPPVYEDIPEKLDFRQMLDLVIAAEDSFYSLDAKVRARFNNDPMAFADYVSNTDDVAELVKLGLANPPKVVDNVPVGVKPE